MTIKVLQILSIMFLLCVSGLYLHQKFSSIRFIIVFVLWFTLFLACLIPDKLEFVKISLQGLSALIACFALLVSIVTLSLQQTPVLLLKNFQIRQAENRLYLYFQNEGSISAYHIKGAYSLSTHDEPGEPGSGITANENLLAFGTFDSEEAFYPNNLAVITTSIKLKEPLIESKKKGFVYFLISIEYPRLEVWKFKIGKKGYDGIFLLNDDMQWVTHTKSHLPKFSDQVFSYLKKRKQPFLPITK